jgi:hypothetical protein
VTAGSETRRGEQHERRYADQVGEVQANAATDRGLSILSCAVPVDRAAGRPVAS